MYLIKFKKNDGKEEITEICLTKDEALEMIKQFANFLHEDSQLNLYGITPYLDQLNYSHSIMFSILGKEKHYEYLYKLRKEKLNDEIDYMI